MINKLVREMENIYKSTSIDFNRLSFLKEAHVNSLKKTDSLKFYPLIRYQIKNKNVIVHLEDSILEFKNFDNYDLRIKHIYDILINTINYVHNKNLKIPNTSLYVWISDRFPWHVEISKYFPVYVFAKPRKTNYIIFPDNTFMCLQIEQKYSGKCYDFDDVKKIIKKESDKYSYNDKINTMYFKGTDTTKRNTNIRKRLQDESINYNWLNIHLDAWKSYDKINAFCKYKYLLNLPGHYPWSNRFKYLFLMKSLVINIDVHTINIEPYYKDPPYVSFINYIVKKNKDFININIKYYRTSYETQNKHKNYIEQKKENQLKKVVKKLNNLYNDTNEEKYEKIMKSGYKKVKKLSMNHIYEYVYNCLIQNAKIINE